MKEKDPYITDIKCPQCSSFLTTDGIYVWCGVSECYYGLDARITLVEINNHGSDDKEKDRSASHS